jgi:HEPN domain-containing protein
LVELINKKNLYFYNNNLFVESYNMTRADDWLKQASRDLEHAEGSLKLEHYEWAVLAAQQGAEKAVKAVFYKLGADPWGHSIFKLMEKLPLKKAIPKTLIDSAKNLDKHYITSRHPNGFAAGTPEEFYTIKDAKKAIEDGKEIYKFCKNQISTIREKADQAAE